MARVRQSQLQLSAGKAQLFQAVQSGQEFDFAGFLGSDWFLMVLYSFGVWYSEVSDSVRRLKPFLLAVHPCCIKENQKKHTKNLGGFFFPRSNGRLKLKAS